MKKHSDHLKTKCATAVADTAHMPEPAYSKAYLLEGIAQARSAFAHLGSLIICTRDNGDWTIG